MTTKNVYRNKPQFETNPVLNDNITPDVPTFKSNAMDNQGFIPLDNCANGCCCHDEKSHVKNANHKCCHKDNLQDHKHKGCKCNYK